MILDSAIFYSGKWSTLTKFSNESSFCISSISRSLFWTFWFSLETSEYGVGLYHIILDSWFYTFKPTQEQIMFLIMRFLKTAGKENICTKIQQRFKNNGLEKSVQRWLTTLVKWHFSELHNSSLKPWNQNEKNLSLVL